MDSFIAQNWLTITIVAVILLVILIYNNLVASKLRIDKALGNIDTYLQKRFDLLNSLFSQCERYMQHEADTMSEITKMRSNYHDIKEAYDKGNKLPADIMKADKAISALSATFESYPQLRAIESVLKTMDENTIVENEINAARRQYNDNVTSFRTSLQAFPSNIIAAIFGFRSDYELYKAEEAARTRPVPMYENFLKKKYEEKEQELAEKKDESPEV